MKRRNAQEPFDKVLVLSTAHVPNNEPDWGENYAVPVDFGWVLWAGEPGDWTPDWLVPAMNMAYEAGAPYIVFDSDAPQYPDLLPTWDW